ncbi:MAG: UDP-N-acetylglucosamine 2-epimerase (non-hydrolyzing) [Burkholderiales bacterium]|nr:UDP-N-acetylglucosamine 2-epimerase (non-hydrolyzing) [Burkholderiales bacterium]
MKLVTVVGARPQFVKAATLSRAIARHNAARPGAAVIEKIVHTGQHYDANMSAVFFDELGIPAPAYHLGIGSGSHGAQTGRMLESIESVIGDEHPDAVLVFGDTNSTLAGALAAAKLHVPVAHVEAGLRSFNRRMPEEVNRVLADHVSRWLFCPTRAAVENLAREGVTAGVENVGDVMYDGMLHYRTRANDQALAQAGVEAGQYVLATVHRAENTDDAARLRGVLEALGDAAAKLGRVVLALHPRTRARLIVEAIEVPPGVHVIEPAPYLEMIALLAHARAVMTDSGGVQKEAFFLEVPCITLREETEWVETLACDANHLVGADPQRSRASIDALAAGRWKPDFSARPYGSGHAAEAIVASLTKALA